MNWRNSSDQPFSLHNIDRIERPILISVPHAGRVYPDAIYQNLAVPSRHLLRLEDRYADQLATSAIDAGFAVIVAQQPRAWIDLNRGEKELDPDMLTGLSSAQLPHPSRKVRGGLGLIPRRLTGAGNLWRDKWAWADVEHRIAESHTPYHSMISDLMQQIRGRFGCALLLDLHSMPPIDDQDNDKVRIVVGDRFGRSSDSRYSELAVSFFQQQGLQARLNHPYAGGYVLDRHADPDKDFHALQLEVDRSLYLDGDLREPASNLQAIAGKVCDLATLLESQIDGCFQLAAAE